MIGIYKIENLINHKCYIGQSVNITKRWGDEKNNAFNKDSASYHYPLSCAFRKYGVQNFSFEILEECEKEELNDKEIYWIEYYDSYNKGYNQTKGGDSNFHLCKLTQEQVEEIIQILLEDKDEIITNKELAKRYNVSKDTIQAINVGREWYNNKYNYPLRISKYDSYYQEHNIECFCIECGKKISKGAIRCQDCENLRKKIEAQNNKPVSKEELKKLLYENNGNFTKVGKMFNITDNALRKWCKIFDLPTHSKDYKIIKEKNIDTNFLRPVKCIEEQLQFSCASDAARWLVSNNKSNSFNSSKNIIPKVCQGLNKTHAGYHWEYI